MLLIVTGSTSEKNTELQKEISEIKYMDVLPKLLALLEKDRNFCHGLVECITKKHKEFPKTIGIEDGKTYTLAEITEKFKALTEQTDRQKSYRVLCEAVKEQIEIVKKEYNGKLEEFKNKQESLQTAADHKANKTTLEELDAIETEMNQKINLLVEYQFVLDLEKMIEKVNKGTIKSNNLLQIVELSILRELVDDKYKSHLTNLMEEACPNLENCTPFSYRGENYILQKEDLKKLGIEIIDTKKMAYAYFFNFRSTDDMVTNMNLDKEIATKIVNQSKKIYLELINSGISSTIRNKRELLEKINDFSVINTWAEAKDGKITNIFMSIFNDLLTKNNEALKTFYLTNKIDQSDVIKYQESIYELLYLINQKDEKWSSELKKVTLKDADKSLLRALSELMAIKMFIGYLDSQVMGLLELKDLSIMNSTLNFNQENKKLMKFFEEADKAMKQQKNEDAIKARIEEKKNTPINQLDWSTFNHKNDDQIQATERINKTLDAKTKEIANQLTAIKEALKLAPKEGDAASLKKMSETAEAMEKLAKNLEDELSKSKQSGGSASTWSFVGGTAAGVAGTGAYNHFNSSSKDVETTDDEHAQKSNVEPSESEPSHEITEAV